MGNELAVFGSVAECSSVPVQYDCPDAWQVDQIGLPVIELAGLLLIRQVGDGS
jgi:hypothetical protein